MPHLVLSFGLLRSVVLSVYSKYNALLLGLRKNAARIPCKIMFVFCTVLVTLTHANDNQQQLPGTLSNFFRGKMIKRGSILVVAVVLALYAYQYTPAFAARSQKPPACDDNSSAFPSDSLCPDGRMLVGASSMLTNNGHPSVSGMLNFIRSIPTMKHDMEIVDDALADGSLSVRFINDPKAPPGMAEERNGVQEIRINTYNSTPEYMMLALVHEFAHIGDEVRLTLAIADHIDAIPKDFCASRKNKLPRTMIIDEVEGIAIDENLWVFMTEQRAYNQMQAVKRDLERNAFPCVAFDIAFPPAPVRNAKDPMQVLQERFGKDAVEALNLCQPPNLINAKILANYLEHGPLAQGDGGIEFDPKRLQRYVNLSIAEILKGKMGK